MNLKQVLEENKLPEFAETKILGFYQDEFNRELLPYCKEHYWCDSESINIFNVVGTAHPDYINLTWVKFIEVGKRMKHNLSLLSSNPSYYIEKDKKTPTMYYIGIDGKLYVDGDGNHRTALAKFYHAFNGSAPILHGVNLKRYVIDYQLKDFIENANSLLFKKGYSYIKVSTERTKISREDTASWMREEFEFEIIVENILTYQKNKISQRELDSVLYKLHKKSPE